EHLDGLPNQSEDLLRDRNPLARPCLLAAPRRATLTSPHSRLGPAESPVCCVCKRLDSSAEGRGRVASVCPSRGGPEGEKPFVLEARQLLMRDEPFAALATAAGLFLCPDAALPAPFPNRVFCTPEDSADLRGRVPFFYRLPFNQL